MSTMLELLVSIITFIIGMVSIVAFIWHSFAVAFKTTKPKKYSNPFSEKIPLKEWFNPFWLTAFVITYPRIWRRRRKRQQYIEENEHMVRMYEIDYDNKLFLKTHTTIGFISPSGRFLE